MRRLVTAGLVAGGIGVLPLLWRWAARHTNTQVHRINQ
jgi:hypothetical protein